MPSFEYLKPTSIDEAISLLESHGERAKYIAGGTDVIVKIKEKKIAPHYVISLRHLSELSYIRRDPEGILRIGALTTHRMLEKSPLIRQHYPVITDAVENIGSVQIRNVATIGGNICNAVPSADGVIPLLTLGAHLHLIGPKGKRTLPLKKLFSRSGTDTDGARRNFKRILYPPPASPHQRGLHQTHPPGGHGTADSRSGHGPVPGRRLEDLSSRCASV